jgi:hypothetical protein
MERLLKWRKENGELKIREERERERKVKSSSDFSQKQHPSTVAVSDDCSFSI